jgi:hypothetical protein
MIKSEMKKIDGGWNRKTNSIHYINSNEKK